MGMGRAERKGGSSTADAGPMLPLLAAPLADGAPIAWRHGRPVSRPAFLAHVAELAARLPDGAAALNLCEDRYAFLVAFAACGVRGQSNLLPASRLEEVVAETARSYPGSYRLTDSEVERAIAAASLPPAAAAQGVPLIPALHPIAVAFTSGSTGASSPHRKRWGELAAGARLALARFGFALAPGATVVATVPAQHMYGLETSIMVPLASEVALVAGRPFFAADIADALAAVPPPRLLISTPAHLRVAVAAGLRWPATTLVISATAPLSRRLAADVEAAFGCPVMEIYGFTEAGSIASRRTVAEDPWTLYDGMRLAGDRLVAPHLAEPVPLTDLVEPEGDGRFQLLGRRQDVVNIAGKRSSLAHLNAVLTDIEGVRDGAFVVPEEEGERPGRLAALVVAPGLDNGAIRAALAKRIDRLFLPRPLVRVDALPRSDTGKLPREALLALLARRRMKTGSGGDDEGC